jgi:alpha-L-rhamnosidase
MEPVSDYLPSVLNEQLLTPDFYYLFFLLEAMAACGKPEEALRSVRKYWGEVVSSGSPTIWEAGVHSPGKAAFGGSASLCHGFSTAPAAYLQRVALGIVPLEAGFRQFRFEPQLPELGFAKGRVPTPHGAIRVNWHWENGGFEAELVVPPGCVASTPAGELPAGVHRVHW